jgi:hypothetical protein
LIVKSKETLNDKCTLCTPNIELSKQKCKQEYDLATDEFHLNIDCQIKRDLK